MTIRFGLFMFCSLVFLWSGIAYADYGGNIYLAVNNDNDSQTPPKKIKLSSFSWDFKLPSDDSAQRILFTGRIAPKKGKGTLIVAKPVKVLTPELNEKCGTGEELPQIVAELPIWQGHFADHVVHYQKYILKKVTIQNCGYNQGAVSEALHLVFSDIEQIPPDVLPDDRRNYQMIE